MLLELEHQRLGDVLSAIEHQAEAIARGGPIREDVINQALDYLRDYPDRCHHPKEDLIAKRIREVGGEGGTTDELLSEHQTLHDLTSETAAKFRSGRSADDGARISGSLRSFVSAYRQHIADENTHFLPLALKTLSQNDFDAIDFRLFDSPDPVFDSAQETRFSELRRELLRPGAGTH
jgi:hemerythrin-like domain-containing protein